MKRKDGKVYRCRDGSRIALIVGDAKLPGAKYSRQGDWYDAETGEFLHYCPKTGKHRAMRENWRDLVTEEREE